MDLQKLQNDVAEDGLLDAEKVRSAVNDDASDSGGFTGCVLFTAFR